MTVSRAHFFGMAIPVLFVGLCLLPGCGKSAAPPDDGSGPRATIQNKGSDTMVNVAQAWAEAYRTVRPNVNVEVSGGGSGVGIVALVRGTVDIANASRNMKREEAAQALANTGKEPVEFIVGFDALAIYVHKDNPLDEISIAQLAGIYGETGRITRWPELGVKIPSTRHEKIIRVSRQSSSGTYEFFREKVLDKKDFKLGSLDMNGSKEVVELVSRTPTAIGYSGMGYASAGVKMLRIASEPGKPAVEPNTQTTLSKEYPIARSLQIYTLGPPAGAVKEYVDWIMGPEGQRVLGESGYVPVSFKAGDQ